MRNEDILRTEFSEDFVQKMKNRMLVSYHKYGPIKQNAGAGLVAIIASLEKRLALYKDTGNTEWLVDVANFCQIEYQYPQHPNAHFRATSSAESPGVVGEPYNAQIGRL